MKKMLLLLAVFMLLPVASALAAHPDDNGCSIYEGQYDFTFYMEGGTLNVKYDGIVDLHRGDHPNSIYLVFWPSGDGIILNSADQPGPGIEICGITSPSSIESGKAAKFWALSYIGIEASAPVSEHPEFGEITALGEVKTNNNDDRIKVKGKGAMIGSILFGRYIQSSADFLFDPLISFDFTFSGRYVEIF